MMYHVHFLCLNNNCRKGGDSVWYSLSFSHAFVVYTSAYSFAPDLKMLEVENGEHSQCEWWDDVQWESDKEQPKHM